MQVMDVIEKVFTDIFNALEGSCEAELAAIGQQFPFEPFVMKPMRFPYADGVKVPSLLVLLLPGLLMRGWNSFGPVMLSAKLSSIVLHAHKVRGHSR